MKRGFARLSQPSIGISHLSLYFSPQVAPVRSAQSSLIGRSGRTGRAARAARAAPALDLEKIKEKWVERRGERRGETREGETIPYLHPIGET